MDQRLPDLVVSAGVPISNAQPTPEFQMPLWIGILGLVIALTALAVTLWSKKSEVLALVFLGLLLGGAGFASASSREEKTEPAPSTGHTASLVETGGALFVAKGCVACHVNDRIDNKYYDFKSDIGPNLTHYTANPDYLRIWLKDPAAVRQSTAMPNLGLDKEEIEALIAYLADNPNQKKSSGEISPAAMQVVTATPIKKLPAGKQGACSDLDRRRSLLVSYSRDEDSYITLVDPSSGAPLCSIERIDSGSAPVYVFTPDRSALAVLSAESSAQRKWRLQWVDLLAWKATDSGVVLDAWSQGMAVNPKRAQVAITYAQLTDEAEPRLLGYELALVNVKAKGKPIAIELDISPRLVEYSGDGQSILVYGTSYDYINGTSTSNAKVRLYSSTDLSLIWETEISSVLDGVMKTGDAERNDPDQFTQWQPALALSPERDKLYIVHSDADQISTVDLAAHRTSTAQIRPRLSWFERLLRLTASPAHAKVLNGTIKQAVLSPDGNYLYVSGFTGLPEVDQQGNWRFNVVPFGLQVVDTANGNEIARINLDASEIDISVDGDTLYLRGWNENKSWTDVLDAGSLDTIGHLDRQLLFSAQTLAGESVLVGSTEGQLARRLQVLDQKIFSPLNILSSNGYWISTP
jgi:cytochrome c2